MAGSTHAGASGDRAANGGQGASGGQAESGGQATGGAPAPGGGTGNAPEGGSAGLAGETGEAGSGESDPCAFTGPNALAHDEFNHDLTGEGFSPVLAVTSAMTTVGSTVTAEWDSAIGRVCPGSFRLTAAFKGYSSSSAEVMIGDIRFPAADWTGAKALHVWVKVQPTDAPLQGVQLFVVSGSDYRFLGVYDNSRFAFGTWYEMVLTLPASASFDPTLVSRVGLQVFLKSAGSAGIPATPPTTNVWLDDIWVEK